ncbi:phosphatase PAP2 family protein [Nitrosophilus alvini]|uniref:phosphatase PAP2 family protein n=1 Tax=Nitrosophilus alvini TaxID=2714855 RepID=UPI00190DBAA3|nr:phosphatase PAP2 family protein [Nitrosophilus alvini]
MKRIVPVTAALLFIILSYLFFDKRAVLYFHETKLLRDFFEAVTQLGRAEIYLIPSFLIYLLYRKKQKIVKKYALLVFWSVAISGIAVNILKIIFARYRPKMLFSEGLYGFDWFHLGHSFASFPSGHSTTAFSAFVAFSFIWPRYRYLFFAAATLIAVSRVGVTAHYPSDIVAGALLGSVTAIMVHKKLFQGKR